MLFKCYLLHIDIILPRQALFSIFLYISYLCDLFVIIFIFIAVNHIILLKETYLWRVFGHFCQIFSHLVFLSFSLIFASFNVVLLMKVLLIKKACNTRDFWDQLKLFDMSEPVQKWYITVHLKSRILN